MNLFLISLLIISIAPGLAMGANQRSTLPMVKASWSIKSPPTPTEDAKTDFGTVTVPVITDAECSTRFKIEKILWSADTTDKQKVIASLKNKSGLSTLEVVITKLFQGRSETPVLVIRQKNGRTAKLTFDNVIELNAWPKMNYHIQAKFNADNITIPKFWTQLEFQCAQGGGNQVEQDLPTSAQASGQAKPAVRAKSEKGRKLHLHILERYPKLDRFYQKPTLYGGLTDNPLAVIFVPMNEWQSLSEDDRDLLSKYAASLIAEVRARPFEYTQVPPTAPAASIIRTKVSKMSDDSWGILAGRISEDGRDIYSDTDKIVRSGR